MIVVSIAGRVTAGKRPDLEAFLHDARPFYESMGNVTMHVLWSMDDPLCFREEFWYATETAYMLDDDRVRNDPVMRKYLERWRSLLDGDVTVTRWISAET